MGIFFNFSEIYLVEQTNKQKIANNEHYICNFKYRIPACKMKCYSRNKIGKYEF